MRGVQYGAKHSYYDLGLLLKSRPNVSPPAPKTKLVKIPGSDRVIDLSENLTGGMKYDTRKIVCEFTLLEKREMWETVYSDILTAIHGKRLEVALDDDPLYVYTGRVTVGELEADKAAATITVTVEADPYKRERYGSGVKL